MNRDDALIDPQRVRALYGSLTTCGDQTFALSKQMQEFGFSAFVWRNRFRESFCASPEQLEIHRQCVVEKTKLYLARPAPPVPGLQTRSLYRSAFLDEMLRQRDAENGVAADSLESVFPGEPWRQEVDPCERRSLRLRVTDRRAYEARLQPFLQHEASTVAAEARLHSKIVHGYIGPDTARKLAAYREVMSATTDTIGFLYDGGKSSPSYPVFSRRVLDDVDLCWVIAEFKLFASIETHARLYPRLEIRRPKFRGPTTHASLGKVLQIEFQHAVPDFENAYNKFHSLDELETIVRAHVALYRLVAKTISDAVSSAYGSREVP